jgi:hypothetical protein
MRDGKYDISHLVKNGHARSWDMTIMYSEN